MRLPRHPQTHQSNQALIPVHDLFFTSFHGFPKITITKLLIYIFGGQHQVLNPKKVAIIVLLTLVLSMTFAFLNPTLALTNEAQKQKAEALISILDNDNISIVEAFRRLDAQNEKRTLGLNDAQTLLNQAKSAYDLGNYSETLELTTQAITKAEESDFSPSEEPETFPFYEILGAILVPVVTIIGIFFVRLRKKPKEVEAKTKKRRIDAERIFREHKTLMPEEKQAIQFLVDNGGEAFEAELYDYVKLPRTTTWRLVKRLKGMGILRVTKFRRQNLVRLKSKYDIKE